MADDEQFSLCWNNFNSNLSAGFHESLCRGDLVDVTLAAEGQFVKAHRLVLSVCSPYFRKMFTQMPANQHAFVFLKDVSHTALKDLIQFMYCGEVNVKQEALPAFISTAEALQIKGLTDSDPPASQSPAEPSTPTPQVQQITSPRVRQQRSVGTRSYKIETVEDPNDDGKQPTQIVIQTATPPQQQTIAQQTHLQQTQQQPQHPAQQIASTATTTSVVSHKRPAQRGGLGSSAPHIKRTKSTIDPLEVTDVAGNTQQISVQTTVVTADPKPTPQSEPEYIDLPIELPTKSEPDYSEEAGEVEGAEHDATYVEDDSFGELRYDETYFTENEDAGAAAAATNATTGSSAGVTTTSATTSKAMAKQQQTFSESSYVESGDQTNNDAQGRLLNRLLKRTSLISVINKPTMRIVQRTNRRTDTNNSVTSLHISGSTLKAEVSAPAIKSASREKRSFGCIVKSASNNHHLTTIGKPRLKGVCVECLRKDDNVDAVRTLPKVITYCPQCPGGMWICEPCFDVIHKDMKVE